MKLSISMPESDVAHLDDYVRAAGLPSRSAGMQHAIRLLSQRRLADDYAAAWDDWDGSADQLAWEHVVEDGVS